MPEISQDERGKGIREGDAITCGRCGARWSGVSRAHCGSCHRLFVSVGVFDLHRHHRGEHGGCLDPETVTDRNGDRKLFYRDGMWRGPEMDDARRHELYG